MASYKRSVIKLGRPIVVRFKSESSSTKRRELYAIEGVRSVHMNHDWLMRMIEQRVNDGHFIRLIRKWLKAGILEEEGHLLNPTTGTPQGEIISPILANIYLHYALDLWIEKPVKARSRGRVVYQRYADDFVLGFEYGHDAESFFAELLSGRLGKFNLSLALEKSGLVRFSRYDLDHSGCFCFLGFEFYWAKTRRGKQAVKRRTAKAKFSASLKGLKEWMRNNRSRPLKELAVSLRRKYLGYFNY